MPMSWQAKAVDALLLGLAPLAAAFQAFAMTARTHALDALMATSLCGNPQQGADWTLLGHCAPCWEAGAIAFGLVLITGLGARAMLARLPAPATA